MIGIEERGGADAKQASGTEPVAFVRAEGSLLQRADQAIASS